MESALVKVNKWMLPLSWLYGLAIELRNSLYENGVLESRRFPMPVISVGNITVGGTGKTPHVEYIIRLLCNKYKVAVLSRGYKRKSDGYKLAKLNTPMHEIGDEPWQMRQKFRNIYVAVDNDRVHGIERLLKGKKTKDVEVVVLDDAFQHRAVTPGLNILLVDYNRLITDDRLLPAGRLREPAESKSRANIVIVTKCPRDITPMGFRVVKRSLDLRPYQHLYFSTTRYASLKGLFVNKERNLGSIKPQESVLIIAGIGSPEQMKQDLDRYSQKITPLFFADHHYFDNDDIRKINRTFESLPEPRIAITTEKDATRLLHTEGLSEAVCDALYVLPIEVEIMKDEGEKLNKNILNYVLKDKRDSRVVEE